MRDHDATRLDSAGQAFESPAGKAMFKIIMVVFGIVVTVLLSLIVTGINRTNGIAEAARDRNFQQDQEIALLQTQTQALQRVSDSTVSALQAITLQMTKNQDAIEHIGDSQKRMLQDARPR